MWPLIPFPDKRNISPIRAKTPNMPRQGVRMTDQGPQEPARYHFDDLTLDTGQKLVTRGEDTFEVIGLE